jgi:hypothetical protein
VQNQCTFGLKCKNHNNKVSLVIWFTIMKICKLNLEFWANLQNSHTNTYMAKSEISNINSTLEPYICQIIRFLP